jgi:hypothetical protein
MREFFNKYLEGQTKAVLSFVVTLLFLIVLITRCSGDEVVEPVIYDLPQEMVQNPVNPISNKTSKSIKKVDLKDSGQILYDALEVSTRNYLAKLVPSDVLDNYEFDKDGKLRLSISELFRLTEESIINQYKNRIVNPVTLDTISQDTLDIRSLLQQ